MKGTVKWIRKRTNNTFLLQVSACPPGETLTVKQEWMCVWKVLLSGETAKTGTNVADQSQHKQQKLFFFPSFVSKYYMQLRVFLSAGAHVYKPPVKCQRLFIMWDCRWTIGHLEWKLSPKDQERSAFTSLSPGCWTYPGFQQGSCEESMRTWRKTAWQRLQFQILRKNELICKYVTRTTNDVWRERACFSEFLMAAHIITAKGSSSPSGPPLHIATGRRKELF